MDEQEIAEQVKQDFGLLRGKELAEAILKQTALFPEKHEQESFYGDEAGRRHNGPRELLNTCGTTGCIAGWALYFGMPEAKFHAHSLSTIETVDEDGSKGCELLEDLAQKMLGLNYSAAEDVFYSMNEEDARVELAQQFDIHDQWFPHVVEMDGTVKVGKDQRVIGKVKK